MGTYLLAVSKGGSFFSLFSVFGNIFGKWLHILQAFLFLC